MPRLKGVNEIKDYLKRSEATVMGWIFYEDLPARREQNDSWSALTGDIDKWQDARSDTIEPAAKPVKHRVRVRGMQRKKNR